MRGSSMLRVTVIVLCSAVALVLAQHPDSDHLRGLTGSLPRLDVQRTDLATNTALTFEGISAIALDRRGTIYVLHRPTDGDPVVVLDPQGRVLRSWGKGMFTIPHGIRVDPAGDVWTVDASTSVVYKFSPQGEKLLQIDIGDVPDRSQGFCGATDIAFAASGRIFVTDGYCNARVIEYDSGGRKVRQWGQRGTGPGEFDVVHAIAVGPDGHLYVADRENGRVQRFDLEGRFLGEWKYGGQLYNVAFNANGDVYISTHPKGVSLDEEFDVVQVAPATGRMLGRVPVRSHALVIGADGTLFPATRSGQLVRLSPRTP